MPNRKQISIQPETYKALDNFRKLLNSPNNRGVTFDAAVARLLDLGKAPVPLLHKYVNQPDPMPTSPLPDQRRALRTPMMYSNPRRK